MANLLTQQSKRNLRKEQLLRYSIVFELTAVLLLVVSSVLLVPTLIVSVSKERGAQEQIAILKASGELHESSEIAESIASINERIQLVEEDTNHNHIFSLLSEVTESVPRSVSVTGLFYAIDDGVPGMVVQGVADTRTDLLDFKAKLEKITRVEEALIPLSSLAKNADIDFSIQVRLKPQ